MTTDRGKLIIGDVLTEQGRLVIGGITETGMLVTGTEAVPVLTATFDTDHVDLNWTSVA